ncbi:MAG: NnrS family protein [Parvibaculum sp.]|nr:NnrS family protein [Parvibaculum sp.]
MSARPHIISGHAALFSFGFRPFFFGGALWVAIAMPLWIALLTGRIAFATHYGAVAWHAHEFLFGYGAAIIVGFLLTAIPNRTGGLPVRGRALLVLFVIWASGRIALLLGDVIGLVAAAAIDSLFLLSFAALVWREVIAGRDWRNLKIALVLLFFSSANLSFHGEIFFFGYPLYSIHTTVSILIVLIMLMGGRIIPSFTRNWLVKQKSRHLPTPFNAFDRWAVGGAIFALAGWTIFPDKQVTGFALLLAGILQAIRLLRWAGWRCAAEPLVLILHVGYGFVPLGFVLVGGSVFWPQTIPPAVALHAWTAGGVGVMTLAVMTRAIRRQSGQSPTAPPTTQLIYLLVILSALIRLATIIVPDMTLTLLVLASIAWTAAFAGFALCYGPMVFQAHSKSR